jgi:hypothetical protein
MARHDAGAVRITSAGRAHSDELAARQRRYVISMSVRAVCFVLAVVFAGSALMWVFIIAAFILPYIAVVMANAAASTDPDARPLDPFDPHRQEIEGPQDT